MPVEIPPEAISERFITSSGPGGQNVNKVATAVQLRVNIFALGLAPFAYRRLKEIAGNRINSVGELIIEAREHRSQEANRREARDRLREWLVEAHKRPKKRKATRASRAAKARRMDHKSKRGQVKKMRGKVRPD